MLKELDGLNYRKSSHHVPITMHPFDNNFNKSDGATVLLQGPELIESMITQLCVCQHG